MPFFLYFYLPGSYFVKCQLIKHLNKIILLMLKFLENRPEDQAPKRSPIKYIPQMCYGNSFQSPQEFQTPHTIFHQRTYLNPFLKFQPKRVQSISQHESLIEPKWTHKVNLSLVEEQKIVGNDQNTFTNSRYLQSFYKQFDSDPRRFRITRGQFTNFIEKNNHNKSIGPLQGIQRTTDRIEHRQQSVWIKTPSKRDEMTASLRYSSSLNTTVKSSIAENSSLLTEKIRIRRNREHIKSVFHRNLQRRKKDKTSVKFQLPRSGPQHQIYLLETNTSSYKNNNRQDTDCVNSEELQKFQNKLDKTFK